MGWEDIGQNIGKSFGDYFKYRGKSVKRNTQEDFGGDKLASFMKSYPDSEDRVEALDSFAPEQKRQMGITDQAEELWRNQAHDQQRSRHWVLDAATGEQGALHDKFFNPETPEQQFTNTMNLFPAHVRDRYMKDLQDRSKAIEAVQKNKAAQQAAAQQAEGQKNYQGMIDQFKKAYNLDSEEAKDASIDALMKNIETQAGDRYNKGVAGYFRRRLKTLQPEEVDRLLSEAGKVPHQVIQELVTAPVNSTPDAISRLDQAIASIRTPVTPGSSSVEKHPADVYEQKIKDAAKDEYEAMRQLKLDPKNTEFRQALNEARKVRRSLEDQRDVVEAEQPRNQSKNPGYLQRNNFQIGGQNPTHLGARAAKLQDEIENLDIAQSNISGSGINDENSQRRLNELKAQRAEKQAQLDSMLKPFEKLTEDEKIQLWSKHKVNPDDAVEMINAAGRPEVMASVREMGLKEKENREIATSKTKEENAAKLKIGREITGEVSKEMYDKFPWQLSQTEWKNVNTGVINKQAQLEREKILQSPLPVGEAKDAVGWVNNIRVADAITSRFTEKEIDSYVGRLAGIVKNMTVEKALQVINNDQKFAEFASYIAQSRLGAFDRGGKQLTITEAKEVFNFVPSGEEWSPADFKAKLRQMKDEAQFKLDAIGIIGSAPRGQAVQQLKDKVAQVKPTTTASQDLATKKNEKAANKKLSTTEWFAKFKELQKDPRFKGKDHTVIYDHMKEQGY